MGGEGAGAGQLVIDRQRAAADLGVHRNTLRNRIATATRVLGADLDDPDVAAHLWLALRASGLAY